MSKVTRLRARASCMGPIFAVASGFAAPIAQATTRGPIVAEQTVAKAYRTAPGRPSLVLRAESPHLLT